jgi:hypothetical protein
VEGRCKARYLSTYRKKSGEKPDAEAMFRGVLLERKALKQKPPQVALIRERGGKEVKVSELKEERKVTTRVPHEDSRELAEQIAVR